MLDEQGQGETGPSERHLRQQRQFELLDVARILHPDDRRLHNCHRVRQNAALPIQRYALPGGGVLISNVQTCGRQYCPVCGPRIRSRRGGEVERLAHTLGQQGYRALRVDWTHAHDLGTSLAAQAECQRALFKILGTGRRALSQRLKRYGGYAGGRRALDYTYGAAGHHLHAHSVLFLNTAASAGDLQDLIGAAYRQAAAQVGLTVGPSGVRVAWTQPQGARYLHKPGLVHAVSRTGSLIPVQLLDQAAQGDADAARVWLEYAQAMQGMRTVSTTPGLKARAAQVPLMPDTHDARLARVTVPQGAVLESWGPLGAPVLPLSA